MTLSKLSSKTATKLITKDWLPNFNHYVCQSTPSHRLIDFDVILEERQPNQAAFLTIYSNQTSVWLTDKFTKILFILTQKPIKLNKKL